MGERIMVGGTEYQVVRRLGAGDFTPSTFWARTLGADKTRLDLVKTQRGTHIYRAIQHADGSVSRPIDTHTTITGRGAR